MTESKDLAAFFAELSEELHSTSREPLAARTLALPDAQSVEDLTALLTSAGER